MSIGDHISSDIKRELYEIAKPKKRKREIDPQELAARQFTDTERMMGKYNRTLHRGKSGAWK